MNEKGGTMSVNSMFPIHYSVLESRHGSCNFFRNPLMRLALGSTSRHFSKKYGETLSQIIHKIKEREVPINFRKILAV